MKDFSAQNIFLNPCFPRYSQDCWTVLTNNKQLSNVVRAALTKIGELLSEQADTTSMKSVILNLQQFLSLFTLKVPFGIQEFLIEQKPETLTFWRHCVLLQSFRSIFSLLKVSSSGVFGGFFFFFANHYFAGNGESDELIMSSIDPHSMSFRTPSALYQHTRLERLFWQISTACYSCCAVHCRSPLQRNAQMIFFSSDNSVLCEYGIPAQPCSIWSQPPMKLSLIQQRTHCFSRRPREYHPSPPIFSFLFSTLIHIMELCGSPDV